jgi:ERCC4-type nuclease
MEESEMTRRTTKKRDWITNPDEIDNRAEGNLSQRLGLLRAILAELGVEWEDIGLNTLTGKNLVSRSGAEQIGTSIVGELLKRQRKVDHREHWLIRSYLAELGFEISHLHTGQGDVASTRVSIERKEDDLLPSLFDDRRLSQLGAMREEAEFSFVIITKSWEDIKRDAAEKGMSTRTLLGYIASLCATGYPPIFMPDHYDAANLMHRIVEKIEDDVPRLYVARPSSPKPKEYRDVIIQALPKIGLKTRRKLVEQFGSLANLTNATIEELKAVEGVGQATAERIHAVFNEGA